MTTKKNYNIERNISPHLYQMLDEFLVNYKSVGLSDFNTYLFYNFIISSYKVPRENRYSIKMLAEELKRRNIKTSLIINIYYHSLNSIALSDGLDIYGDGFLDISDLNRLPVHLGNLIIQYIKQKHTA